MPKWDVAVGASIDLQSCLVHVRYWPVASLDQTCMLHILTNKRLCQPDCCCCCFDVQVPRLRLPSQMAAAAAHTTPTGQ
jgi:hypothetical protein